MRYLSVCTGILGCKVALEPVGWTPVAYSEIDPYCCELIRQKGGARNLGDMEAITDDDLERIGPVDALVGGTPCVSFSVAGLRKGLDDPRGNLALVFLRLAERARARWVVWENVPGVLSSGGGRDFGAFLGGLAKLGYGFAYRVLDAQHFGLAQRRKRVFVVGRLGDWRGPAAVLLERSCLRGDSAPSREAGAIPADLTANGVGTCGGDDNQGQAGHLIASPDPAYAVTGQGSRFGSGRDGQDTFIAFDTTQVTSKGNYSSPKAGDPCHPLAAGAHAPAVAGMGVRRLTPTEAERLQGFPDGWTAITMPGGKPASDSARYRALGNSWAVPVVRWIGRRIADVDTIG